MKLSRGSLIVITGIGVALGLFSHEHSALASNMTMAHHFTLAKCGCHRGAAGVSGPGGFNYTVSLVTTTSAGFVYDHRRYSISGPASYSLVASADGTSASVYIPVHTPVGTYTLLRDGTPVIQNCQAIYFMIVAAVAPTDTPTPLNVASRTATSTPTPIATPTNLPSPICFTSGQQFVLTAGTRFSVKEPRNVSAILFPTQFTTNPFFNSLVQLTQDSTIAGYNGQGQALYTDSAVVPASYPLGPVNLVVGPDWSRCTPDTIVVQPGTVPTSTPVTTDTPNPVNTQVPTDTPTFVPTTTPIPTDIPGTPTPTYIYVN